MPPKTPKQAPQQAPKPPATFLVCGHQTPPGGRPNVSNEGVNFNESASLYTEPAMCLTCSVTHAKNRQQTIVDTYQSQLDAKFEEIIHRAVKVSSERDRVEILETGKRMALAETTPKRNAEIADVWLDFAKIWNSAERNTATPPTQPPSGAQHKAGVKRDTLNRNNNARPGPHPAPPAPPVEVLSIRVDKTNGHIAVILTWRSKAGVSVEKEEVMNFYKVLRRWCHGDGIRNSTWAPDAVQ